MRAFLCDLVTQIRKCCLLDRAFVSVRTNHLWDMFLLMIYDVVIDLRTITRVYPFEAKNARTFRSVVANNGASTFVVWIGFPKRIAYLVARFFRAFSGRASHNNWNDDDNDDDRVLTGRVVFHQRHRIKQLIKPPLTAEISYRVSGEEASSQSTLPSCSDVMQAERCVPFATGISVTIIDCA